MRRRVLTILGVGGLMAPICGVAFSVSPLVVGAVLTSLNAGDVLRAAQVALMLPVMVLDTLREDGLYWKAGLYATVAAAIVAWRAGAWRLQGVDDRRIGRACAIFGAALSLPVPWWLSMQSPPDPLNPVWLVVTSWAGAGSGALSGWLMWKLLPGRSR